jgi:hypothetical protein
MTHAICDAFIYLELESWSFELKLAKINRIVLSSSMLAQVTQYFEKSLNRCFFNSLASLQQISCGLVKF